MSSAAVQTLRLAPRRERAQLIFTPSRVIIATEPKEQAQMPLDTDSWIKIGTLIGVGKFLDYAITWRDKRRAAKVAVTAAADQRGFDVVQLNAKTAQDLQTRFMAEMDKRDEEQKQQFIALNQRVATAESLAEQFRQEAKDNFEKYAGQREENLRLMQKQIDIEGKFKSVEVELLGMRNECARLTEEIKRMASINPLPQTQ